MDRKRTVAVAAASLLAMGVVAIGLTNALGAGSPSTADTTTLTVAPGESPPAGVFVPRFFPDTPPADDPMWTNPTGSSGQQIDSVDPSQVGFRVDEPSPWLGKPVSVWFLDSNDLASREVWWMYDDPSLGRVLLREEIAYEDQGTLEEPANASPGCTIVVASGGSTSGECNPVGYSIDPLSNGSRALVAIGDSVAFIKWLEPLDTATQARLASSGSASLELTILVPASQASPDGLVSLADKV